MKRLDLTNQRFGRLTALYFSGTIKGNTFWRCICDCGTGKDFRASHLKSGLTKSCGCYSSEVTKGIFKKYNKYDLSGNYGIGYTRKGEEFYFDLEDYEKIKDYCWYVDNHGYVISRHKLMHKLIFKEDGGMFIDHINRNKKDNRKSNLRNCTKSQNGMNHKISPSNTTGIIGVNKIRSSSKYHARIQVNGSKILLGNFENIEDAIIARLKAEKVYFGEFSPQRHLFEQYGI